MLKPACVRKCICLCVCVCACVCIDLKIPIRTDPQDLTRPYQRLTKKAEGAEMKRSEHPKANARRNSNKGPTQKTSEYEDKGDIPQSCQEHSANVQVA